MKKEFKLVSASVIGLVCASLMTPSFAVTAVRSLGGAGTYTGTTSAAQSATTARAGSVRVGGSTRTSATSSAALRTPSTRSATAPRLSIGKYLSTHSSLGTGNKVVVENSNDISNIKDQITDIKNMETTIQQNIDSVKNDLQQEIKVNIEDLQTELESYLQDVELEYDSEKNALFITYTVNGTKVQGEPISLDDLGAADDALNELISGDMISIAKDEKTGQISVSANVIVGALTGKLEADKLVTANQTVDYVTGYAIPKPQDECNYNTCVLSFQEGQPYWLELVDKEPAPDGE